MSPPPVIVPQKTSLYYGGEWREPERGRTVDSCNPATGELLATIADAGEEDVAPAVAAARAGFEAWRDIHPYERAKLLREIAAIVRKHGAELAMLDAADCGNPFSELMRDVDIAAFNLDYFAGLVSEMKGSTVPLGPGALSYSVREPYGVVARICPFNHPMMFSIGKIAAPLAAGNSVIVKPPEQAPLSALRAAELLDGLLPPGVFNVLPGGRDLSAALVAHPDVAMIAAIGSVPMGKAVARSAADQLKPTLLELGGKNALVALPDADPDQVASAAVRGMNFSWCGQSCGSTSRAFIHDDIYEAVIERLPHHAAQFRPGLPTDPATTMGCLVSRQQFDRVVDFVASGKAEGARLVCGGSPPQDQALAGGLYLDPTIFADVTMDMRIAREEIFGPVLSVLRWNDEAAVMREVNSVPYGLTFSVFTRDISRAHRLIARAEAGFCWINEVGKHFPGTSFGGYKLSGGGREESLAELLAFTQEKTVYVNLEA
jgi:betaine-aldehyde dehydrogenase